MKIRALFSLLIIPWITYVQSSYAYASYTGLRKHESNIEQTQNPKKDDIQLSYDTSYFQPENFWGQLRQKFNISFEENNPLIQKKMEWYYKHPRYLIKTLNRAKPWLYFILEQTKKRHLPAELVLLPVIESAYNTSAQNNSSGAAGLWQIKTATDYGLSKNWWYDGRFDVIASTTAALDHLAGLYKLFSNDWLLALAAYDAGEGRVLAAIRKNKQNGKKTDFWSLKLPKETENYVPKLLALTAVLKHPDFFPVKIPNIPNEPYITEVKTGIQLDLMLAASLAHIKLKTLKNLNPGYNHPATDPKGSHHLVLPIKSVVKFKEQLKHVLAYPQTKWVRYKIKSGETLKQIAKHFSTTQKSLRKRNPNLSHKPHAGEQILVAITSNINKKNIKTPPKIKLHSGDTLYMVRKKDTLQKIARHFHVKQKNIKSLNKGDLNTILVGQKLLISTHNNTKKKTLIRHKNIFYTVQNNENLSDIALKFHTSLEKIRLINLLENQAINSGDLIVIPI